MILDLTEDSISVIEFLAFSLVHTHTGDQRITLPFTLKGNWMPRRSKYFGTKQKVWTNLWPKKSVTVTEAVKQLIIPLELVGFDVITKSVLPASLVA